MAMANRVLSDPQDASLYVIVIFSIKPSHLGVNSFVAIPCVDRTTRTQYTCGFNHFGIEGYPIMDNCSNQPIAGHVSSSEIGVNQNRGWFVYY